MTVQLIDEVAAHAVRTGRTMLPEQTRRAVEALLLDSVGVGVAGSITPESSMLSEMVRTWGDGAEASVWGTGVRLPAGHAAMVNAHQMHCLEYDSIHEAAVVHPMSVVLPVVAAFVQRQAGRGTAYSGARLLAAVTAGVDVAAGLGVATTTPLRFFRPATAGVMGGIAALAALTQAPEEQIVGAFGVGYGALSGTMQAHREGAQVLALQVAMGARSALNSWDLADIGFRGPRQVLDGPFGYFGLIESAGDAKGFVERLGHPHEVEATSIKPFPSGRATHGALSALIELQERHGLTLGDVERVTIRVPPMVRDLVGRRIGGDLSPGAARLCLPYLVAVMLDRGAIELSAYDETALRNSDYVGFAERVEVVADDNPDPNAFDPQELTVHTKDGSVHTVIQEESLGSPGTPIPDSWLRRKFATNLKAAGRGADIDALTAALAALSDANDVAATLDRL